MLYRQLGKTGAEVSVIGIGTWQYGGEWGIDYTQPMVDEILDAAAAGGINLIDTAECYGDHLSEKFIGDYLKRRDRDRWFVATKFGHDYLGNFMSRADRFEISSVITQLESSLKALKVEQIDLYQFHSGPDHMFGRDELWTMLDKAKQAGKIRFIGASLNKTTTIQSELAAQYGIEVLQVVYNRIDTRSEDVHFPSAQQDQLGILARVPLASGLLSGKYHSGVQFAENDVRSRLSHAEKEAQLATIEKIRHEEVPEGVSMASWALAWCLRLPVVTSVIPGCKNMGQVHANLEAIDTLKAVFPEAVHYS